MQEGALLLRPKSGSNRIETPTRLLSVCQAINKQPIDINKSQRLQQMKTMMMTTRQVVRGPLPDARRRDRYRTALHSSDPSQAEGPKGMSAVLEKAEKNNSEINTHFIERKIGIPAYKMKSSKMKIIIMKKQAGRLKEAME